MRTISIIKIKTLGLTNVHRDMTGVFHHGFDREHLRQLLLSTGFTAVRDVTATSVSREVPGKGICDFPVFLMVAGK